MSKSNSILVKLPSRDRVEFFPISKMNPNEPHVVVVDGEDKVYVYSIAVPMELNALDTVKVISKALPIAFPDQASNYSDDPANYQRVAESKVIDEKEMAELLEAGKGVLGEGYFFKEDGYKAIEHPLHEGVFYLECKGEPVFEAGKKPGQLKKGDDVPDGMIRTFFNRLVKEKVGTDSYKIYEEREDGRLHVMNLPVDKKDKLNPLWVEYATENAPLVKINK